MNGEDALSPIEVRPFEADSHDAGLVLRLALQLTGLGVFERDLSNQTLIWRNDRMYDLYGWPRGQALYDERAFFAEVVHPDDRQLVRDAIDPVLAHGGTARVQHRIRRRVDNRVAWLDVQIMVLTDEAGRPVRLVGVAADVTAQQLTRVRVEESERQFRTLFEALPVGVVIGRRSGGVYLFNEAAVSLLGYNRDAFAKMVPPDYVVSHSADEIVALRERCFAQGSLVEPMRFRAHDGREIDVMAILQSLELQGRPMLMRIWVDITERRQAERVLQRADRAKDQFLAMLAHELRNPMAPLRNAVRILERDDLGADQRQAVVAMMRRQCMQMGRLVDDLLEVSRITQNKIRLRLEPTTVDAVVQAAVETVQTLVDAKDQRLDVTVHCVALIVADPLRLTQVVTNLLTNASKFTPESGRITLAVNEEADSVVIRVRDTGSGIPADVLPHVFDLFSQADQSLDRSQGGLGIGLALVKRLVELHGGTVAADSAGAGAGTCMTVRLPCGASVRGTTDPSGAA